MHHASEFGCGEYECETRCALDVLGSGKCICHLLICGGISSGAIMRTLAVNDAQKVKQLHYMAQIGSSNGLGSGQKTALCSHIVEL